MRNELDYNLGYNQARLDMLTAEKAEIETKGRASAIEDEGIREAVRARAWGAAGTDVRVQGDTYIGLPDGVPEGFDLDAAMETLVADHMEGWKARASSGSESAEEPVSPVVKAFREGLG